MLPVAAMLPSALISPCTNTLALVMILPAALTVPVVRTLAAVTLPAALNSPGVKTLPEVMLPATDKLVKMPNPVRLLVVTLALRTLPVSKAALAKDTTPVSWLPLPTKNAPVEILPATEICESPWISPCTFMPEAVTTSTSSTPALLIEIALFSAIRTLLVPLAIPDTPPRL